MFPLPTTSRLIESLHTTETIMQYQLFKRFRTLCVPPTSPNTSYCSSKCIKCPYKEDYHTVWIEVDRGNGGEKRSRQWRGRKGKNVNLYSPCLDDDMRGDGGEGWRTTKIFSSPPFPFILRVNKNEGNGGKCSRSPSLPLIRYSQSRGIRVN